MSRDPNAPIRLSGDPAPADLELTQNEMRDILTLARDIKNRRVDTMIIMPDYKRNGGIFVRGCNYTTPRKQRLNT